MTKPTLAEMLAFMAESNPAELLENALPGEEYAFRVAQTMPINETRIATLLANPLTTEDRHGIAFAIGVSGRAADLKKLFCLASGFEERQLLANIALHYAVPNRHQNVIRLAREAGANSDWQPDIGYPTAREMASDPAIASLL